MRELSGRFLEPVSVAAATMTQYSATNTTTDIAEAKVVIPSKPPAGLTFRVKLAGTKTGANAAMIVHLKLGATQVLSLTADDVTAVDWTVEIILRLKTPKAQKVSGRLLANTADPSVDYADGTVDVSAGAILVPQIQSQHGSDVVYCEFCTIETWTM